MCIELHECLLRLVVSQLGVQLTSRSVLACFIQFGVSSELDPPLLPSPPLSSPPLSSPPLSSPPLSSPPLPSPQLPGLYETRYKGASRWIHFALQLLAFFLTYIALLMLAYYEHDLENII